MTVTEPTRSSLAKFLEREKKPDPRAKPESKPAELIFQDMRFNHQPYAVGWCSRCALTCILYRALAKMHKIKCELAYMSKHFVWDLDPTECCRINAQVASSIKRKDIANVCVFMLIAVQVFNQIVDMEASRTVSLKS